MQPESEQNGTLPSTVEPLWDEILTWLGNLTNNIVAERAMNNLKR